MEHIWIAVVGKIEASKSASNWCKRGPEKAEGMISRNWLRERILNKDIILQTIKDKTGKYGRLLGIIWDKVPDGEEYRESINDIMFKERVAKYKMY